MRVLVAVLSLVVLVGCQLNTDYFGEYRDVNLLGNYNFDAVETNATPKWALATSPAFMTWEKVDDADRPTDAVYRLEIKNLIPNGDFDNDAVTPEGSTGHQTGWSMTSSRGTVGGNLNIKYVSSPSIRNRSLVWVAGDSGDQLRVDLATVLPSGAWGAGSYRFRVDLINMKPTGQIGLKLLGNADGTSTFNIIANADVWTVPTLNADLSGNTTDVFSSSEYFAITEDPPPVRIIAIGALSAAGGAQEAIIDNIRLLPDDLQNLAVRATLPKLKSGVLELLPGQKKGMYVFSFDVKDDPTAGTLNRFQPSLVSVRLDAKVNSGTRNPSTSFIRPVGGWQTWTTLSYSLGLDFVGHDGDLEGAALTVSISPTIFNTSSNVDVGSVLISRPVLTFNP